MRTKLRLLQLAKLGASLIAATLYAVAGQSVAATERVGDFALLDEQGRFHQLSRYQHRDAVVMLTLDGSCSAAMNDAKELGGLQSQFGESVEFIGLDVSGATRSERHQWQLPFPVLGDEMKLGRKSGLEPGRRSAGFQSRAYVPVLSWRH